MLPTNGDVMVKLPVLKLRNVCKILEKAGFRFLKQEGSHMTYTKIGNDEKITVVTVPHYPEIDRFVLLSIIKQSKMTREEFLKLLD